MNKIIESIICTYENILSDKICNNIIEKFKNDEHIYNKLDKNSNYFLATFEILLSLAYQRKSVFVFYHLQPKLHPQMLTPDRSFSLHSMTDLLKDFQTTMEMQHTVVA